MTTDPMPQANYPFDGSSTEIASEIVSYFALSPSERLIQMTALLADLVNMREAGYRLPPKLLEFPRDGNRAPMALKTAFETGDRSAFSWLADAGDTLDSLFVCILLRRVIADMEHQGPTGDLALADGSAD